MAYWGYHLMLDCAKCDVAKITDAANIDAFVKELVPAIDMVAYGEPQIVNFGTGNKEGYTLVQLIETSNICAHFCNDSGDAYIDIFSCKEFNTQVVLDTVKNYFSPMDVKTVFAIRDAQADGSEKKALIRASRYAFANN